MAEISTGPAMDLDRALGKARNRINRVGIELEGGWIKLPDGIALTRDSSVVVKNPPEAENKEVRTKINELMNELGRTSTGSAYERVRREIDNWHKKLIQFQTGELPSEPMEVETIAPWMRKYYPSHVNNTCGLHVHMSFKSAYHYQRLMVPEYLWTVVEYIARWAKKEGLHAGHPIWPRLQGKSEFCQHVFDPDRQAFKAKKEYDHHAPGHRYTAISYAYARYGTVECRLLPMMEDAELGVRAVQKVIDVTNALLSVQRKRETKVRGEVVIPSTDDTYRNYREERL